MAETTLLLRPLQRTRAANPRSAAFRIALLSFFLVTGSIMTGCGSGDDGGDGIPTGDASASLAWDPVGGVVGYYVYYGTQSPNTSGSCAYQQSTFTSTPEATVTGLAEEMTYYFAVSAFNGIESACSAEVSTVTESKRKEPGPPTDPGGDHGRGDPGTEAHHDDNGRAGQAV